MLLEAVKLNLNIAEQGARDEKGVEWTAGGWRCMPAGAWEEGQGSFGNRKIKTQERVRPDRLAIKRQNFQSWGSAHKGPSVFQSLPLRIRPVCFLLRSPSLFPTTKLHSPLLYPSTNRWSDKQELNAPFHLSLKCATERRCNAM